MVTANNCIEELRKSKTVYVVGLVGEDEIVVVSGDGAKRWMDHRITLPGYFAANIAKHLEIMGIDSVIVTTIGEDRPGERVLRGLPSQHIHVSAVSHPERATPSSLILVEGGERIIYRARNSVARDWVFDEAQFSGFGPNASWCLIGPLHSDVEGRMISSLIERAKKANVPCSISLGETQVKLGIPALRNALAGVRLLSLNLEEAVDFCNLPRESRPETAARYIGSSVGGSGIIIVSNGGLPGCCFDRERDELYEWQPANIQVVDPTGAGDALHAYVVGGILNGYSIRDALDFASGMAARVCLVYGGGRLDASAIIA